MRNGGDGGAAARTRSLAIVCALLAWSTGCCAPDRSPAKGTDAGVVDAGAPDAGAPDAALPDAGFDAARPDAGTVAVRATGRFFDHPDRPIRDALANEAIDEVERGGVVGASASGSPWPTAPARTSSRRSRSRA